MTRFPMTRTQRRQPARGPGREGFWILVAAAALLLMAAWWTPALADDAADDAAIEVPASPDAGMATMGSHSYRSYCASCHGPDAEGHGSIATMLTVPPSDLTAISERSGGDFPYERVYRVIDGREKVKGHGTADMPAWGDAFQEISESEEEVDKRIHQLVQFLWTIQD